MDFNQLGAGFAAGISKGNEAASRSQGLQDWYKIFQTDERLELEREDLEARKDEARQQRNFEASEAEKTRRYMEAQQAQQNAFALELAERQEEFQTRFQADQLTADFLKDRMNKDFEIFPMLDPMQQEQLIESWTPMLESMPAHLQPTGVSYQNSLRSQQRRGIVSNPDQAMALANEFWNNPEFVGNEQIMREAIVTMARLGDYGEEETQQMIDDMLTERSYRMDLSKQRDEEVSKDAKGRYNQMVATTGLTQAQTVDTTVGTGLRIDAAKREKENHEAQQRIMNVEAQYLEMTLEDRVRSSTIDADSKEFMLDRARVDAEALSRKLIAEASMSESDAHVNANTVLFRIAAEQLNIPYMHAQIANLEAQRKLTATTSAGMEFDLEEKRKYADYAGVELYGELAALGNSALVGELGPSLLLAAGARPEDVESIIHDTQERIRIGWDAEDNKTEAQVALWNSQSANLDAQTTEIPATAAAERELTYAQSRAADASARQSDAMAGYYRSGAGAARTASGGSAAPANPLTGADAEEALTPIRLQYGSIASHNENYGKYNQSLAALQEVGSFIVGAVAQQGDGQKTQQVQAAVAAAQQGDFSLLNELGDLGLDNLPYDGQYAQLFGSDGSGLSLATALKRATSNSQAALETARQGIVGFVNGAADVDVIVGPEKFGMTSPEQLQWWYTNIGPYIKYTFNTSDGQVSFTGAELAPEQVRKTQAEAQIRQTAGQVNLLTDSDRVLGLQSLHEQLVKEYGAEAMTSWGWGEPSDLDGVVRYLAEGVDQVRSGAATAISIANQLDPNLGINAPADAVVSTLDAKIQTLNPHLEVAQAYAGGEGIVLDKDPPLGNLFDTIMGVAGREGPVEQRRQQEQIWEGQQQWARNALADVLGIPADQVLNDPRVMSAGLLEEVTFTDRSTHTQINPERLYEFLRTTQQQMFDSARQLEIKERQGIR